MLTCRINIHHNSESYLEYSNIQYYFTYFKLILYFAISQNWITHLKCFLSGRWTGRGGESWGLGSRSQPDPNDDCTKTTKSRCSFSFNSDQKIGDKINSSDGGNTHSNSRYIIKNTVTIWILDKSGIWMVQTCPVIKRSGFQMVVCTLDKKYGLWSKMSVSSLSHHSWIC